MILAPNFREQYGYYLNPFLFLVDGKAVVFGECDVQDGDIEIKYVESLEKGKGYASLFIRHLIDDLDFNEVWGESVVDAFHFWKKVGAVFDEWSEKYFREHIEDGNFEFEEDFLIPFTITNPKQISLGA